MNKVAFIVTLKAPVLVPSKAVSEGEVESLDYLPGSLFLGLAAQRYNDYKNPFILFHSTQVRFGNAMLMIGGTPTCKAPLSWHKKADGTYVNLVTDDRPTDGKIKQERTHYADEHGRLVKVKKRFFLKSAFDADKRRSADEQMFGYECIDAGSQWYFELNYEGGVDAGDIDRLKASLIGKHRIGKSRNAQFGAVFIEETEPITHPLHAPQESDQLYLYALSDLALGDLELEIDYEKSFIRTRSYAPYVSVRGGFDAERHLIVQGSVLALKQSVDERTLGLYQSEGFGRVLLNPKLLFIHPYASQTAHDSCVIISRRPSAEQSSIVQWAKNRFDAKSESDNALKEARKHANLLKNSLSRAQINTLRHFIRMTETYDIFQDVFKRFAEADQRKEKWKELIPVIKNAPEEGFRLYIETLAKHLANKTKKQEESR